MGLNNFDKKYFNLFVLMQEKQNIFLTFFCQKDSNLEI